MMARCGSGASAISRGDRPRFYVFSGAMRGTPAADVPLFLCPICGWTTTASLAQAVRAHELGVPECDGVLEQLAYAGKRMSRSASGVAKGDPGQASSAAAATDT
jgi:hypothetical protein